MNRLSWMLFATVLFLGGCLAYSTHVQKEQSRDLRWLLEHCEISER